MALLLVAPGVGFVAACARDAPASTDPQIDRRDPSRGRDDGLEGTQPLGLNAATHGSAGDAAPPGRLAPAATAEPRPPNTIFRHELERATHGGRPPYLMRQLGPVAHRPGGRFIGWKITRVWPDDPELCAAGCDLRPGDVIVAVNGRPIQYPEELSDLMAELQTMARLEVQMLRDGELRKVEYDVVEAG